jgi:hypothetical protein
MVQLVSLRLALRLPGRAGGASMSGAMSSLWTEVKAERRSLDRPGLCREVARGVGVDICDDGRASGRWGAGVSTYAAGSCMSSDSRTPVGRVSTTGRSTSEARISIPCTGVGCIRISPEVRLATDGAIFAVATAVPRMAGGPVGRGLAGRAGLEGAGASLAIDAGLAGGATGDGVLGRTAGAWAGIGAGGGVASGSRARAIGGATAGVGADRGGATG